MRTVLTQLYVRLHLQGVTLVQAKPPVRDLINVNATVAKKTCFFSFLLSRVARKQDRKTQAVRKRRKSCLRMWSSVWPVIRLEYVLTRFALVTLRCVPTDVMFQVKAPRARLKRRRA